MKVEEMKSQRFADVTFEQWKETAEASLKGKPLSQLYTETYENIQLKPLYLRSDVNVEELDQFPGEPTFTRGFYKGGYIEKPWHSTQELKADTFAELKEKLVSSLNSGQGAISFSLDSLVNLTAQELDSLLNELGVEHPLYINTQKHFLGLAALLTKGSTAAINGVAGTDMLSGHAANGLIPSQETMQLHLEALELLKNSHKGLKTIIIDTVPYHMAGANAVQELAMALAEAVFYLEWLTENGWTAQEVAEKLVFHFAIGSAFFMEVAKLRAFRKIWTAVSKEYGLTGEGVKVTISAETSRFTLSKLDKHVNILRTGNEAFAAVLGGVEYLQVVPFDELSGKPGILGERIAKNIPLLLTFESHLDKVVDPAGGSYYVESLTTELGTKAWELFLQVEEKGGILEALKSGWLQQEIANVMEKRSEDLATRKQSMIGTNIYSDLNEEVVFSVNEAQETGGNITVKTFQELLEQTGGETALRNIAVQQSGEPITAVAVKRLAEPFERLRERAKNLQDQGKTVQAGLICLGKLKDFKPRADFVSGMLSAGGISVLLSNECATIEDAIKFVQDSSLPYYCICGKDDAYSEFGPALVQRMKEANEGIQVEIAGKLPAEAAEEWKTAGLDGAVYARQNILNKLSSLLTIWEGGKTHE